MDDLIAWLRAQLDDDERVARAVADHRQRRGELRWTEVDPESQPGLIGDQCGGMVTLGGPGGTSRWHAAHVARHDPARVLAEVDAKRRILELYEELNEPHLYKVVRLLALPYVGYREEWRP